MVMILWDKKDRRWRFNQSWQSSESSNPTENDVAASKITRFEGKSTKNDDKTGIFHGFLHDFPFEISTFGRSATLLGVARDAGRGAQHALLPVLQEIPQLPAQVAHQL